MRAEYDFSKGKRGALFPQKGKTRITIYIDDNILEDFRARAEREGIGYQTLINDTLRKDMIQTESPVTETILRQVIREELPELGLKPQASVKSKTRKAG